MPEKLKCCADCNYYECLWTGVNYDHFCTRTASFPNSGMVVMNTCENERKFGQCGPEARHFSMFHLSRRQRDMLNRITNQQEEK